MGAVLLGIVLLTALAAARLSWSRVGQIADADVRWLQGIGANDSVFPMIHKYLYRTRAHRWMGAVVGVISSLVASLVVGRRVTAGVGANEPWFDVLFCGLAGVIIGSIVAEVRRRQAETKGARQVGARSAEMVRSQLELVAFALVILTVALALFAPSTASAIVAGGAVAVLGCQLVLVDGLRLGSRELVELDLRHADDSIRTYSIHRFALETLAWAILVSGWQLGTSVLDGRFIGGVIVVLTLLVSLFLVLQSRPYPERVSV